MKSSLILLISIVLLPITAFSTKIWINNISHGYNKYECDEDTPGADSTPRILASGTAVSIPCSKGILIYDFNEIRVLAGFKDAHTYLDRCQGYKRILFTFDGSNDLSHYSCDNN